MITSAEERALASAFPVFRNLSESLRRELRDGARHVSVPASATLFQDGAPCQAYPLLLRGSVPRSLPPPTSAPARRRAPGFKQSNTFGRQQRQV